MKNFKFYLHVCIVVQTGKYETTTSDMFLAITEDETLVDLRRELVELKEKELNKKIESMVITSITEISKELYDTLLPPEIQKVKDQ